MTIIIGGNLIPAQKHLFSAAAPSSPNFPIKEASERAKKPAFVERFCFLAV